MDLFAIFFSAGFLFGGAVRAAVVLLGSPQPPLPWRLLMPLTVLSAACAAVPSPIGGSHGPPIILAATIVAAYFWRMEG